MARRPGLSPGRLVLALALAALLLPAAGARADGDPASDVLLSQDVFEPYAPRVSKPVSRALATAVRQAKAAGFPVEVALIQTAADLGAYPALFGRPQRYADLLAVEIALGGKPRILTVMPSGFGTRNLGPGAAEALRGIRIDRDAGSDGLALAAARAVAAVAGAAGHPIRLAPLPAPAATPGAGRRSGAATIALYLAPVLLLATGGGLVALRGRRRGRQTTAEHPSTAPGAP